MDKRADLAIGVAIVLLGLVVVLSAQQVSAGTVSDPVGTAGVPAAVGVMMALLGGLIVIRRIVTWTDTPGYLVEEEGKPDDVGHPASAARAFGLAAAALVYSLVLLPVGFVIATPILLTIAMLAMRERRVWIVIAVAVGATAVIHLVFVGVFGILLPLGPLDPFNRILWFRW